MTVYPISFWTLPKGIFFIFVALLNGGFFLERHYISIMNYNTRKRFMKDDGKNLITKFGTGSSDDTSSNLKAT